MDRSRSGARRRTSGWWRSCKQSKQNFVVGCTNRLRKSVSGSKKSCGGTSNTTLSRAIRDASTYSYIGFDCFGGECYSTAAKRDGSHGSGCHRCSTAGFPNPASFILTLNSALPPLIQGGSRMRRRARTDLCGGRSAMVVPTASGRVYGQEKSSGPTGGGPRRSGSAKNLRGLRRFP